MRKFKLTFTKFRFRFNGKTSTGMQEATIRFFDGKHWTMFITKKFIKRITLKPGDTADLNKAYKMLQAMIERSAYWWASEIISKDIKTLESNLAAGNEFVKRAQHITAHDLQYIESLDKE
jgi:hypothetical protein